AVAEMRRGGRPGGGAGAPVGGTFRGVATARLFLDSAAAVGARAHERRSAPFCRPMTPPGEPGPSFTRAGFIDSVAEGRAIRMELANFADYWMPTITGQGSPAELMASLPGPTRERIENSVRAGYLCNRPDGPRSFTSLAWAVRGVVPRTS